MNIFTIIFLHTAIIAICAVLAYLTFVTYRMSAQIEALQTCVLHLLTEDREEKKPTVGVFPKPANTVINNSYNFDISGPTDEDTETKIADIQALFKAMPAKEADQLADVIQLHGDKITDKKEKDDE